MQADNSKQENFRGRCLMVLAMAAFAIEDSVIKMLSVTLPVGQILILLGLAGALIFFFTALGLKKRIWTPEILTWPMHLRIMSEILGRIFYSTALAFMPLASSTMILQATPLTIGASFFQRKVGALRWVAVITGLFGVLIIIQPTAANFSILSILAVLGMLGFAGRDLASRAVSKSIHVLTLGVHGFLSIAAAAFLAVFFNENSYTPT